MKKILSCLEHFFSFNKHSIYLTHHRLNKFSNRELVSLHFVPDEQGTF